MPYLQTLFQPLITLGELEQALQSSTVISTESKPTSVLAVHFNFTFALHRMSNSYLPETLIKYSNWDKILSSFCREKKTKCDSISLEFPQGLINRQALGSIGSISPTTYIYILESCFMKFNKASSNRNSDKLRPLSPSQQKAFSRTS